MRLQSAMEYLMTYGWAILIIAVVLGALFQLGVFNGTNFTPRAPPGSCQIFRPNGPYSNFDVNLEGECSGVLPQYVAQFNGQSSGIELGTTPLLQPQNYTVTFWISFSQGAVSYWGGIFDNTNPTTDRIPGIWQTNGAAGACLYARSYTDQGTGCSGPSGSGTYFALNKLYFVAVNKSGSSITVFVNGARSDLGSVTNTIPANSVGSLYIGISEGFGRFNGTIANVQFYNASLSANEIQALYLEGIGGAPIDTQSVIGWWPLNGNANDYSGNGNSGQATGVVYTGSYLSEYTIP